jgi:hypothetical protein
LLYGRRAFASREGGAGGDFEHEVLLVDARWANLEETNRFKLDLWQHYRLESDSYEQLSEFDQVVKAARPAYAALSVLVLGAESASRSGAQAARYLVAHDWLGMPLAFCAQIQDAGFWRLVFYAHEMATARILVEDHLGHDTRFYNVLQQAQAAGMTMDQLFGDRSDFFKHALTKQAVRMDSILAVGGWVEQELRFLGGDFASANIDLVYSGVPFREIGLEERAVSTARLQQYCQNLLGHRPDYLLTHVSRMIISKAIWRDIHVLEHLDRLLAQDGKTAVFFVLSTAEPSGRVAEDVLRWEAEYGWPVTHRADNGDLIGHEESLYRTIEEFNGRAQAIQAVLVNQFGWSQEQCGTRMPDDMVFGDLRRGTDLEFGQSIYEPFGIAQIEPLAFGALCVVSNVCGCIGLIERASREAGVPQFANFLQADYTTLTSGLQVYSPWDALEIDKTVRDRLEKANGYNVALAVRAMLPATTKQARNLLRRGQRVGRNMSWGVVVRDYLLPALKRAE